MPNDFFLAMLTVESTNKVTLDYLRLMTVDGKQHCFQKTSFDDYKIKYFRKS